VASEFLKSALMAESGPWSKCACTNSAIKGRGEDYAERFANRHFDLLYEDYVRVFGDPARSQHVGINKWSVYPCCKITTECQSRSRGEL
jgi:hypothetical protein